MLGHIQRRRVVFFDLDGTLHKQDIFGSFIIYLLINYPLNIIVLLLLLPVIALGLVIKGFSARFPMSLLLWSLTVGRNEHLSSIIEKEFVKLFKSHIKIFPIVQKELINYLNDDTDVWIITGSPQKLVEDIYCDFPFFKRVNLIASVMERRWGGLVLKTRCLGYEKVIQLEKKIGAPLKLYSGYSDSKKDDPLLVFCQKRWRVTPCGILKKI
ncbi:phosphatidylglycerophosphatase C [Candidatus Pantoea edessiphila]|uniref:Phosphatidylglycerophosphatase C n=1 Tax=Candidatus Pantoea edessiphila TaxID=2044610 RepID=A0A2P5SYD5_9GAMM|nr:phosphatidylglycerophosphatase C [Candidatus Pantoea edessiphila]MBK4775525.1 acid phosphatase AphA [Pantoea sp. Edef]PPI87349.1 phosphatidylglycerophosphatase C [Candidatus Pantoea edessiphila]